jgi:hypothetical protein
VPRASCGSFSVPKSSAMKPRLRQAWSQLLVVVPPESSSCETHSDIFARLCQVLKPLVCNDHSESIMTASVRDRSTVILSQCVSEW